jgi:hypothetical protein
MTPNMTLIDLDDGGAVPEVLAWDEQNGSPRSNRASR